MLNASALSDGYSIQWYAPELLDPGGREKRQKHTGKLDVYSLSMVIVEVCTVYGNVAYPDSDCFSPSLLPGECRFLTIKTRECLS